MITINMDKAKVIAHDMRRTARAEEFKPLDEVIMKQLPNTDFAAIESDRQVIRDKYAVIQTEIDSANNVDELKAALSAV